MPETLHYPMSLDQAAITALLPHRGEMLFIHHVQVLTYNHYQGQARWHAQSAALQGHFPGLPVVPGVLLVEAVAQVAGAGMLAGDPTARAQGPGYIGVLAGIRKCAFKRPVYPDEVVDIEITSRQMAPLAVHVSANLQVAEEEAASIEILLVHTPKERLLATSSRMSQ